MTMINKAKEQLNLLIFKASKEDKFSFEEAYFSRYG